MCEHVYNVFNVTSRVRTRPESDVMYNNIIAIKTRSGERRSRMGAKRFRRDRDDTPAEYLRRRRRLE